MKRSLVPLFTTQKKQGKYTMQGYPMFKNKIHTLLACFLLITACEEKNNEPEVVEHIDGVPVYSNLKISRIQTGKREKTTFKGAIVDASVLAYSHEFANKYGYPKTYETSDGAKGSYATNELPPEVALIEFRIKAAGPIQDCRLNLLVDKSLNLRLAGREIYNSYSPTHYNYSPIALPYQRKDWKENLEQHNFRMGFFDKNHNRKQLLNSSYMLASSRKNIETDGKKMGKISSGYIYSTSSHYPEMQVLSIDIGCGIWAPPHFEKKSTYLIAPREAVTSEKNGEEEIKYLPSFYLKFPKKFQQESLQYLRLINE